MVPCSLSCFQDWLNDGNPDVAPRCTCRQDIVGIENQPDVMRANQIRDGGVSVRVKFRHGGFRPEEQIGSVRERAFRESEQFAKTI